MRARRPWPRRSRPISCRSPCCSSCPGRSASGSAAGGSSAPATSSTRRSPSLAGLAPGIGRVPGQRGRCRARRTRSSRRCCSPGWPTRCRRGRSAARSGRSPPCRPRRSRSPRCAAGCSGAVDWRLAFFLPALVAAGLALLPPADARPRDEIPRLRAVMTRRVGLLSGAAFAGYAGVTGVGFLVAVLAADDFGLASVARGLLLAGFGVAGMLLGRAAGDAVDRYGRVPVGARRRGRLRRPGRAARPRAHRGGARRRCGSPPGSARRWSGPGSTRSPSRPCRATGRAGRRCLGVQVRRQRRRAADVAAALPRRPAPRLPRRGRDGRPRPARSSRPCACHARARCSRRSAIPSPRSSTRSARSSPTSRTSTGLALFLALRRVHRLPHAAGAGVVPHPACGLSGRASIEFWQHLGRLLRRLRLQLGHPRAQRRRDPAVPHQDAPCPARATRRWRRRSSSSSAST